MSIPENLAAVEARIAEACRRAGRERGSVTLVAVSKTFPASAINDAIAAGITDVGENRVQEVREKKSKVGGTARWHLIGHLQSNKAKDAVKCFDVIQSVDSVELAQKISRAATKPIELLLQVNIGNEPQKNGISPSDLDAIAKQVSVLENIRLRGLMTIPPVGPAAESRRYFRMLRAMRDGVGVKELSMGMSEDFEVAIEEGATIVRVGRAIFGMRSQ